ncbi:RND transporter [Acinetobacter genomosp. 33YU]|uniref:TolC family outer membrane protein n=1 Tax=Acinetobacter TaxID=469 RepID=UPI00097F80EA|nr:MULTISPECIES: TolC family outer membrane protein [Acinetobacter]ONN51576.1 RND transporter [Acinetobacter genomosp. 33YU]PJG66003.1 RND transporter [Acinetobacter seifertii]
MPFIKSILGWILFSPFFLFITQAHADTFKNYLNTAKNHLSQYLGNETENDFQKVSIQKLSDFNLDDRLTFDTLPVVTSSKILEKNFMMQTPNENLRWEQQHLDFTQAIYQALQRRPEVTQSIATIAGQNASIDAAKAAYYPQISGGITTADLTSGERGRQLFTISVSQMLYDFGKTKSSVDVEKARLFQDQAKALSSIDDIAYQTANAIVNIKRYQEIIHIADQQINGIAHIAEIANLRANAGISSQADPVQAQSNLEAAQSNKIVQETQLKQYQQKLRNLLGYDVSNVEINIPEDLVKNAGLYDETKFTLIPEMLAAQAAIQIAKYQKEQTKLSNYPTISIKGNLSQALNGKNPNNNEDDGFYNSIMLETTSNFFQGGAVRSRERAASYAEEAAKAELNTVYLDISDQVQLIRQEIENKQKQIQVLRERQKSTTRTKELYQEQYKLGTRSVVDLLNSEQAIHSAAQEIETAKYDIYSNLVQFIKITGRSRDLYHLNNTSIQGFQIQP